MSEDESQNQPRRAAEDGADRTDKVIQLSASRQSFDMVRFDRRELDQILRIYSMMVGAGEWRDYAIDHMKDRAVFSIFRRSSEIPLYRIEKNPKLARRQGAYSVIAASGMVLKRGHDLANVLKAFDKPLRVVASK
ncbi:MAG: DUF2794 domain-containing protein [Oricola sp.]